MKTTLAAALVLGATLLYLSIDEKSGTRIYFGALACFLLANLAKISFVTWPVILLGYEWQKAGFKVRKTAVRKLIPFFIISLIVGIINVLWYDHNPAFGRMDLIGSFFDRLARAGQIVIFYLYKVVAPINLSLVYYRWEIDPTSILDWVPTLLVGGFLGYLVAQKKYLSNRIHLLAGYVLVSLFPALGFFDIYFMRFSWVADHYLYLTLAGIIAAGAVWLSGRQMSAKVTFAILSVTSILYVTLTILRTSDYVDEETLWKDTLSKNKLGWIAHINLGSVFGKQGRRQEAIVHYKEALNLNPESFEARHNYGLSLFKLGEPQKAIEQYTEALRINPFSAPAHFNFGVALATIGHTDQAIAHYSESLRIKPKNADAETNLGAALFRQGNLQQARLHFINAIKINPTHPEANNNLGAILLSQGKVHEAIRHFKKAIAAKSNYAEAEFNLGTSYDRLGSNQEAIAHYSRALILKPDYPEARSRMEGRIDAR